MKRQVSEEDKIFYKELTTMVKKSLLNHAKGRRRSLNPAILKFAEAQEARSAAAFWKNRRLISGKSQKELSDALGYDSPQIISNIERGQCGVPMAKLAQYAKLLGIKKDDVKTALLQEYAQQIDRAFEK